MSHTLHQLLQFIQHATSPYHTVQSCIDILEAAHFSPLALGTPWHLLPNHAYYVPIYGSTLIAFTVGANPRHHLRIAAAHTDFPCLRVKPSAAITTNVYGKLNTEIYGGMIRESWLDRPLSLAGKVALRGQDPFHPEVQFIDIRRPILTIPRLAIHMNPKTNDGITLNPQKDMLPLMTLDTQQSPSFFTDFLAEICNRSPEDILSYELTVYPVEEGCIMGLHNEFISSPRLDNLTSVYACLTGLTAPDTPEGIHVIALFDNEEVGSHTKQGAASQILPQVLTTIYESLGYTAAQCHEDESQAFILSIDVAHAMHPNVPEKCDPTNMPILGQGIAIKTACSQSYAGDAEAVAILTALCQSAHIPYQYFVNRSDMRGGSTIGSLLSAQLPIRTMDIGIPILSMHSARELMGATDQGALQRLTAAFFTSY